MTVSDKDCRRSRGNAPERQKETTGALLLVSAASPIQNAIRAFRIGKQPPVSLAVANGQRFPRLRLFRP